MPQVPLKIHARELVSLKVAPREEQGKGPVGQMRRVHGQLPGVIYGHKQDVECIKTDAHSLERILSKGGQNAIILIEHEESSKESEQALIREIQYHKVSGDAMHLDLLRIDPTETLRANVPIITVGVPEGVRTEGGSLQQALTALEMECVVSEMPSAVEIDITSLQIGDSVHVSDLIEQEPRITSEGVRTIANVLVPRLIADDEAGDEEEELEEEAEAGGEDAAAAGDEGGEE